MDGVVLEESTLPEASVDADNENIQYRMEAGDGCALSKGANQGDEGRGADEACVPWSYGQ